LTSAPHAAQLERGRVPELGNSEDAGAVKPLLHARADAVDLLQFEAEQNVGQIIAGDHDEAVGFLQIGTDFAEKDVGREADRAGEALADLLAQRAFDFQRELAGERYLSFSAHQEARHFIDRANLFDRQARVDRLQDALVILGIEPMVGLHRDDGRAQPPRLPHQGAGLDAVGLCRVAGGNRDGGFRRRLHDDDGPAAQGRVFLLLARCEEGVEIEEQPLDGIVGR
jgi:hypothetical protein